HITPSTTYTLSLHDALPISYDANAQIANETTSSLGVQPYGAPNQADPFNPHTTTRLHGYAPQSASSYPQQEISHPGYAPHGGMRSEEHTSELQSRGHLVCRL